MNLLEKNILERFCKGDENAFEDIFKTFYGLLINYARQILKDNIVAEEVVETTYMNLWENHTNLHIETSIKSYLFKCVYNNCLNHLKHLQVKERYILYFKHHVILDDSGNAISNDYPLSQLLEKEMEQALGNALKNLPPQCREIFLLSRHEDFKNDEIAAKLNLSVNTVRTQISRALMKLRENLKEFLPIALFCFLNRN